jgi:hypothetical protein
VSKNQEDERQVGEKHFLFEKILRIELFEILSRTKDQKKQHLQEVLMKSRGGRFIKEGKGSKPVEAEKSPKSGKKSHRSSGGRAQSPSDFECRESTTVGSAEVARTLTLCAMGPFRHFVTGESRGRLLQNHKRRLSIKILIVDL